MTDDVARLIEELRNEHRQGALIQSPLYCDTCNLRWPCPPIRAAEMLEKLAKLAEDSVYNHMTRPERVAWACRVLAL